MILNDNDMSSSPAGRRDERYLARLVSSPYTGIRNVASGWRLLCRALFNVARRTEYARIYMSSTCSRGDGLFLCRSIDGHNRSLIGAGNVRDTMGARSGACGDQEGHGYAMKAAATNITPSPVPGADRRTIKSPQVPNIRGVRRGRRAGVLSIPPLLPSALASPVESH